MFLSSRVSLNRRGDPLYPYVRMPGQVQESVDSIVGMPQLLAPEGLNVNHVAYFFRKV